MRLLRLVRIFKVSKVLNPCIGALLLALLLVACSTQAAPASEPTAAPTATPTVAAAPTNTPTPEAVDTADSTPQTVQVELTDELVFVPDQITINAGDTIQWNNVGSVPHNIVFEEASVSGTDFLAGGASYEATFSKAGTYKYVCEFHPPDMVGNLIVK